MNGIIGLGGIWASCIYQVQIWCMDVKKLIINAWWNVNRSSLRIIRHPGTGKNLLLVWAAMKKMAMHRRQWSQSRRRIRSWSSLWKKQSRAMEGFSAAAVPMCTWWPGTEERRRAWNHGRIWLRWVGAIVNNATTAIAFGDALPTGTAIIVSKTLTVSGNAIKKPVSTYRFRSVYRYQKLRRYAAAASRGTCEWLPIDCRGPMMVKRLSTRTNLWSTQGMYWPFWNSRLTALPVCVLENVDRPAGLCSTTYAAAAEMLRPLSWDYRRNQCSITQTIRKLIWVEAMEMPWIASSGVFVHTSVRPVWCDGECSPVKASWWAGQAKAKEGILWNLTYIPHRTYVVRSRAHSRLCWSWWLIAICGTTFTNLL